MSNLTETILDLNTKIQKHIISESIAGKTHLHPSQRLIIGITGPPGSGKTTLAKGMTATQITSGEKAVYLPQDGFHLSNEVLEALGLEAVKGAPETFDKDGYALLLHRIRYHSSNFGDRVFAPDFDHQKDEPIASSVLIDSSDGIIITEGNYLLLEEWNPAAAQCDVIAYVDRDDEKRKESLIERQLGKGKTQQEAEGWFERVDSHHAELVEQNRDKADIFIANP